MPVALAKGEAATMARDEPALLGGSDPVPDSKKMPQIQRPTPVLSSRVAPAPRHDNGAIALTRGATRRHSTGSFGSSTSRRRQSIADNVAHVVRRPSSFIADTIKALPLAFDVSSGVGGTAANASDEEGRGVAGIFANKFHATLRALVDEGVINAEAIESRLTECRLAAGGNNEEKVILDTLIEQILPKYFSRYVELEQNQRIAEVTYLFNDFSRPLHLSHVVKHM